MNSLLRLHRIYFIFLIIICSNIHVNNIHAHANKATHAYEISSALGFTFHPKIHEWLCYISSDMIDKHNPFYSQLVAEFPGFKCTHRCLFHWNYNGMPWTAGLENKVIAYTIEKYGKTNYRKHFPSTKEAFLTLLRKEQKRRNRLINTKTEQLFRFASGGRDASYANFFASMAYDLHLLGDYTSDNTDLNGLVDFNTLVNGIISTINRLDVAQGKEIIKAIKKANSTGKTLQARADDIMEIMLDMLPKFIKKAQDGTLKRRLEKLGYKFL